MTQVQTLIRMLKRGWVSTGDAFNAGITSYHRRLADLREAHYQPMVFGAAVEKREGQKICYGVYLVNGKNFNLVDRERSIKSRWGRVTIKEWRLVAVK